MVPAERLASLDRLRADLAARNALVQPVGGCFETGFSSFDALIGGFPRPGFVEVSGCPGSGRLHLFLPLLVRLGQQGQHVAIVDVLERLYPPGLPGVDFSHLLVVRPGPERAVWATEQILSSGSVPLVLLLDPVSVGSAGHRLLHACERGHSTLGLVGERPDRRLPASLRLETCPTPESPARVRVLHQRRGAAGQVLELRRDPGYLVTSSA